MMAIRNWNTYHETAWDWGMFNGCFDNPRVALSDLDGALERNGYLLIVETKTPGADLSGGQKIAFTNLCRTRKVTVIVVWGHPQRPVEMQIYHRGHVYDRQPCDGEFLRLTVSRWYRWAGSQPPAWTPTSQPGHRRGVHRR